MSRARQFTKSLIKEKSGDAVFDRCQYMADLDNPIVAGVFRIHRNNTANYPDGIDYSGIAINFCSFLSSTNRMWLQIIFPMRYSGPIWRLNASGPWHSMIES